MRGEQNIEISFVIHLTLPKNGWINNSMEVSLRRQVGFRHNCVNKAFSDLKRGLLEAHISH